MNIVLGTRVAYENKHSKHIIARISTKIDGDKKYTLFDCKNVNKEDRNLKISSESLPK